MRLATVFALLLFCGVAYGQTSKLSDEQIVERVITSGVVEGNQDKQISRLGDAAAVAATKVIGGKLVRGETITASDVNGVAIVLRLAFAAPTIVDATSDREPKTAIVLLQFLGIDYSRRRRQKRY